LGYFETVHATLMVGRRQRGRPRARVSAAVAHAINFHTWQSLAREQQLSDQEAITLTTAMVQAAAQRTLGPSSKPKPQPGADARE
jgi:hypothetical protein